MLIHGNKGGYIPWGQDRLEVTQIGLASFRECLEGTAQSEGLQVIVTNFPLALALLCH